MFRVSSKKNTSVIRDPTQDEIESYIKRAVRKRIAVTEINRIVQALNLFNSPELQESFSVYSEANITSLRLRYKQLITAKIDNNSQCLPQFRLFEASNRWATELKRLRRAVELLVTKILTNPKAYLRLDDACTNRPLPTYAFSIVESLKEKMLLIKIGEQVAYRQLVSPHLRGFSETASWMNDQNEITKLSSLTLTIIMNIKACFHKLLERYNQCLDYNSRSDVVAEMEPLALFLANLEYGIRHYPRVYTLAKDGKDAMDVVSNSKSALVPRVSSGF